MDTFNRRKKQEKLKRNIEVSLEREVRQVQETQRRKIGSEERKKMRKKWVQGAERVEKTMLSKVWNPKQDEDKPGKTKGYFGGLNFDKEGKIMLIKILFLVLSALPVFLFSQGSVKTDMFNSANVIDNSADSDTLDYRIWIRGVASPWYATTTIMTSAEKTAGTPNHIDFAAHANWSWGEFLQLRIRGAADTVNSLSFGMGYMVGSTVALIVPYTIESDSVSYHQTVIGGR
jgi:hypothetical protein